MATRRQLQLAELLEREGAPEEGGAESGDSNGLPGRVVLEELNLDTPESFETRVKPPRKSAASKDKEPAPPRERKQPAARGGTREERSLQQIGQELEEQLNTIFGFATLAMPVTGVYATENSDKAIAALINIAKRRPAVYRALTKVADGVDGVAIGRYVLGCLVAVQVDLGRIDADSVPARALGVTAVVEMIQGAQPEQGWENPNVVRQDVGFFQTIQ